MLNQADIDAMLKPFIEMIEADYDNAGSRGISDAVVVVKMLDRDAPDRAEISLWERLTLAQFLADKCSGAADLIKAGPVPGKPLTIVFANYDGVSVINRALPEASTPGWLKGPE